MTDPFTTSIVTALVTGATAAVSDAARGISTKLVSLIHERFRRTPSDESILDAATRSPADPAAVRRLVEVLDQRMREDPVFAEQLKGLWTEMTSEGVGDRHDVSNTVSGPVHGSVVQARDVFGGITFNEPPRPHPPQD